MLFSELLQSYSYLITLIHCNWKAYNWPSLLPVAGISSYFKRLFTIIVQSCTLSFICEYFSSFRPIAFELIEFLVIKNWATGAIFMHLNARFLQSFTQMCTYYYSGAWLDSLLLIVTQKLLFNNKSLVWLETKQFVLSDANYLSTKAWLFWNLKWVCITVLHSYIPVRGFDANHINNSRVIALIPGVYGDWLTTKQLSVKYQPIYSYAGMDEKNIHIRGWIK